MIYHCTIEKEGEEYIAHFPDMPHIATCGFSQNEALYMAKDALDGILSIEIEDGADIPAPKFKSGYPITVANHLALAIELRALRGEKTQGEVAEKLGISYQAYQRLENPKRPNPTIKTLEKIANVYGKELSISIS